MQAVWLSGPEGLNKIARKRLTVRFAGEKSIQVHSGNQFKNYFGDSGFGESDKEAKPHNINKCS
jgi:hypothetical protein